MRMTALAPVLAAALLSVAALPASASNAKENEAMPSHPYVGLWVTEDGYVRQELRANGRYDEARGNRQSAYQGRYEIDGDDIRYWDDTGFTADGRFIDGVLHHGGMIMRREEAAR
jgi:hypothetical protein